MNGTSKTLTGPVFDLYDCWIEEHATIPVPVSEDDIMMLLYGATQFCLKVAAETGDHSPIFNNHGSRYLGAFMVSKHMKKTGSTAELVKNMGNVQQIFINEASAHSGFLSDTLQEAGNCDVRFLHSALESIGLTKTLSRSVVLKEGKVVFDTDTDCGLLA